MQVRRMRATIERLADRGLEFDVVADLRRDLRAHRLIDVDAAEPLRGTHRDLEGRAYFEFATGLPEDARRLIDESAHGAKVTLAESPALPGPECLDCGNVAGPMRPTVCPNCGFREISPCPHCGAEVPRDAYRRIGGATFRCPTCRKTVDLRFNSEMFLPDGNYNQPLVLVEEATALHEVR